MWLFFMYFFNSFFFFKKRLCQTKMAKGAEKKRKNSVVMIADRPCFLCRDVMIKHFLIILPSSARAQPRGPRGFDRRPAWPCMNSCHSLPSFFLLSLPLTFFHSWSFFSPILLPQDFSHVTVDICRLVPGGISNSAGYIDNRHEFAMAFSASTIIHTGFPMPP